MLPFYFSTKHMTNPKVLNGIFLIHREKWNILLKTALTAFTVHDNDSICQPFYCKSTLEFFCKFRFKFQLCLMLTTRYCIGIQKVFSKFWMVRTLIPPVCWSAVWWMRADPDSLSCLWLLPALSHSAPLPVSAQWWPSHGNTGTAKVKISNFMHNEHLIERT